MQPSTAAPVKKKKKTYFSSANLSVLCAALSLSPPEKRKLAHQIPRVVEAKLAAGVVDAVGDLVADPGCRRLDEQHGVVPHQENRHLRVGCFHVDQQKQKGGGTRVQDKRVGFFHVD